MKILLLHLSDLHIKETDHLNLIKVEKMVDSLNVIGGFDECVIIFSGDLAYEAKINEYKKSKSFFGKLFSGIRKKYIGDKFINLIMVPGNHDVDMTTLSRDGKTIQNYYDNNCISEKVPIELSAMNNFFTTSHAKNYYKYNKILDRRFLVFGDYRIQFNMINTALFSTLCPDDKELHYFPSDQIFKLQKQKNVDVVITVMHHGVEWFNWICKADLEKGIYDSSSLLFTGHDHQIGSKDVKIDNSGGIWISAAGSINIGDIKFTDKYSAIILDTNNNTIDGYMFEWSFPDNIYKTKIVFQNKNLYLKSSKLFPKIEFLNSIKEDQRRCLSPDFTRYYVFPTLLYKNHEEYKSEKEIKDIQSFFCELEKKKYIIIEGKENAGKTMLAKYIYCELINNKIPLFLSIEDIRFKKIDKLIKQLFEEQYGDDNSDYEKYRQTDKSEKVIIIDDFDLIKDAKSREKLMDLLKKEFEYIILTTRHYSTINAVENVKHEISNYDGFHYYKISLFYLKKREELVRKVCEVSSSMNTEDIDKVNKIINSLVKNQPQLFDLCPDYILQYVEFFIKENVFEIQKGESIFNKVFEHNINSAIIKYAREHEVEEIFTSLEEVAYYIHFNKRDPLPLQELQDVIKKYNEDYNEEINATRFVAVACEAKILKKPEDSFSVKFANRNYLAFFVAKYLFKKFQNEGDFSGIQYLLENICFGINDNIVLFISYFANNVRIIMSICEYAKQLLTEWEELDFDKKNIKFIMNSLQNDDVKTPTFDEKKEIEEIEEKLEEEISTIDELEVANIYDYNEEEDIKKFFYKILRALKYTEMISKALPAFHNNLKAIQKKELIAGIYEYPNRILYGLLKPIDDEYEACLEELKVFADKIGAKNKKGKDFTKEEIAELLRNSAIGVSLGLYDMIAQNSVNKKTLSILSDYELTNSNKKLLNIMMLENIGNTTEFIQKAEEFFKNSKDVFVKNMIRRVVRKHVLCSSDMNFRVRQKIADKFFGKNSKQFLLPSSLKEKRG